MSTTSLSNCSYRAAHHSSLKSKLAVLPTHPSKPKGSHRLSLFASDIAVSYHGTIHRLAQEDFNRILELASQTFTLPVPDRTLDLKPKENYEEEVLQDLIAAVLEAREEKREKDDEMITRVKGAARECILNER
ncbi:hypothetical protein BDQ17DRAFT_1436789 [Cyathus striatus]|nr:hypothetical protein BDQ17DRAFT_1436789 [Cyathus striatus]